MTQKTHDYFKDSNLVLIREGLSTSLKDSLDTVINNLMILAPNNAQLIDSLTSIRECYSSRLPAFINGLKSNKKSAEMCDIEYMRSLVPGNSILSPLKQLFQNCSSLV